jgi:hypothetical protein
VPTTVQVMHCVDVNYAPRQGTQANLPIISQRIGDASSALDHCLALVELLRARQR